MRKQQISKILELVTIVAVLSLVTVGYAMAAGDIVFLKLEGVRSGFIQGKSIDDKHRDQIDVLSWSWGGNNGAVNTSGAARATGRPTFQDLIITKYIDKASPRLMQSVMTGELMKNAMLSVTRPNRTEYQRLSLDECIISSVSMGKDIKDDRVKESITMICPKYKMDYIPFDQSGKPLGPVSSSFDSKTGKM